MPCISTIRLLSEAQQKYTLFVKAIMKLLFIMFKKIDVKYSLFLKKKKFFHGLLILDVITAL